MSVGWHGEDFWTVDLPGQPFSGNHMTERNRGGPGLHKKAGVEAYQTEVTYRVRQARPPFWHPQGQIIVNYWFYLKRDMDCTNAIKVIEDAVASALRPEDPLYDRMFLPRAIAKETGHQHPYVVVGLEAL